MPSFRVVVPTRDSARWVGVFLDAYRAFGVEPFYVVDARSQDATLEILRGKRADFKVYKPSDDFAEAGMIEFGSKNAGADWVLRIDDDEFPSRRLVEWAGAEATKSFNQAWVVLRRTLFFNDGAIYCSRSFGRRGFCYAPALVGPHMRLHHVRRVRFVERVHTIGFEPPRYFGFAPEDAVFAHFDCLLRSAEERAAKIRRYEAIEPGSSWRLGDEYLPELFPLQHHHLATREGLAEFAPVLAALPLVADGRDPGLSREEAATMMRATMAHRDAMLRLVVAGPVPYENADDLAPMLRAASPFLLTLAGAAMRLFGSGAAKERGARLRGYLRFARKRFAPGAVAFGPRTERLSPSADV
jgi:hypothetical protein